MFSFAPLMKQTAYVASKASTNHGVTTYSAPVAFSVRFEPSNLLVRTTGREEKVASCTLYTLRSVSMSDRVWPPGADTTKPEEGRSPLKVDAHYHLLTGQLSHYTVVL